MPTWDYLCDKCGYTNEYCTNASLPKEMKPPKKCPECGKGKMKKQFSVQGQSFDIIGSCYMNDYGKHAWKKHMNDEDKSKVLTGEKNPY